MRKKKPLVSIGECVWCDEVFVVLNHMVSLDNILKAHIVKDCKKHPMRKLERKIKRLEKK